MARRALVVGAGGGVGMAVSRHLLDAGYEVVASVLNQAEADVLRAANSEIEHCFFLDMADADSIAGTLSAEIGNQELDAVVCCAGIATYGPIETTPLATLRRVLEINAVADVALFQATMEQIRRSRGRYAFISSLSGRISFPFIGHYSASKFALEALADAMRREVMAAGVHVSLIEPGGIRTPMVDDQIARIAKDRASLGDQDSRHYAHLFAAHEAAVKTIKTAGVDPVKVADAVLHALTAADPQARYLVGDDAVQMDGMARTMSDADLDRIAAIDAATSRLGGA